jgi:xanthine dehydrogenase small subunit
MRDHLLLYLNGRQIRVDGQDAYMTLSDFVRKNCEMTGTKVVCAEGDCGSCAVLIGRVSADGSRLQYASVTSCIQLMFQLDATHVITVEGLKYDGELNPIQESMVKCHGAQCGFCTPGFVVSLHDIMQGNDRVDAHAVRRGLVGNLCRCTGYDSIVRAALEADRDKLKSLDELYPPQSMLGVLSAAAAEEVRLDAGPLRFFKPTSLTSATAFRQENPQCLIVAGASDLGVQRNKGTRRLSIVMSTAGLKSLQQISTEPESLCVGGAVTLSELERATETRLPEMSRFLAYFGSSLIKNSGTLAGNLVNASPIGDMIPALFALDAEIELAGPSATRWINIHRFYTGYRKTVLASNEIVTRVWIPLPAEGETFKLYKISKRKDLDISSFGAAIWMRRSGRTIEQIRIAYGGVGPTVMRMARTEALLHGKIMSLELFEQAGKVAREEVTPISDVRGSDEYRRLLAQNIMIKFWHNLDETNGVEADSPAPATGMRDVFVRRSSGDLP